MRGRCQRVRATESHAAVAKLTVSPSMMSEPVRRNVVVANQAGLHARSATMIAALARNLDAVVTLTKVNYRVEATDVLQIMSLGAAQGQELLLEATGPQAQEAADAVEALFVRKFDEE
jgi:phosphotransferase system HPr (HPr) family protein